MTTLLDLLDLPEPESPTKASQLALVETRPLPARDLIARWHSRLPVTQEGTWRLAFVALYDTQPYGAALWGNPSSRMLPQDWLELRRLAIGPTAPHCSASWMLGAMRRWIKTNLPEVPRLLSYQDVEVHTGTIYKAAGWEPAYFSKPQVRDRSLIRIGTRSRYRTDSNGSEPSHAGKIRWEVTP